jgi:hypothetical protein
VRSALGALGLAMCLAMCLAGVLPAGAVAQTGLTVDGTEFVLRLDDGRILRGSDLKGATLKMRTAAGALNVTIRDAEEDPQAVGGRVLLHHFVTSDAGGKAADLCLPDADGKSLGFPVPDARGGFELTCTSGAIAKCIRWGYRPWDGLPGGAPLRALHRACVHMVRADYAGDGSTHTRDGTLIYVCDRFGVRPCEKNAPLAFEAAWGELGATCVARPRVPQLVSLDALARRYPRLRGALGPACAQESAAHDPAALLFNRSQE